QASADKGGDDEARVTAKSVDRAQSGGQRVVKAPKAVLKSAVTYLRQEKLLEDERFVKFLAVLAGVNDTAELAHLLEERPQHTPKEGAAKSKKAAKPVGTQ
ncbi:hypothetical protein RZS08_26925, partial [Arthrospira platensis SPKY1]|nr:hypothetical protein [Arthrospira platensis SPKY1]